MSKQSGNKRKLDNSNDNSNNPNNEPPKKKIKITKKMPKIKYSGAKKQLYSKNETLQSKQPTPTPLVDLKEV